MLIRPGLPTTASWSRHSCCDRRAGPPLTQRGRVFQVAVVVVAKKCEVSAVIIGLAAPLTLLRRCYAPITDHLDVLAIVVDSSFKASCIVTPQHTLERDWFPQPGGVYSWNTESTHAVPAPDEHRTTGDRQKAFPASQPRSAHDLSSPGTEFDSLAASRLLRFIPCWMVRFSS